MLSFNIITDRGISAPVNGVEVAGILNDTEKRLFFHLMTTGQFPGSELFDSKIVVHIATQNFDVSLALEFQIHLSNASRKHGILDHGNRKKCKIFFLTNRYYHVGHNKDVNHQYMNMYSATTQFSELHLIGPHNKPHGVRGLGKHYHIHFDPKIGHDTCEISHIPSDYSLCTYMLDQPWESGIIEHQEP